MLYVIRIVAAIVVFFVGTLISYWLLPTGSNRMVKNASLISHALFRVRVTGAQYLQDIPAQTPIVVAFSHRADTDQLLVLSALAKLDPRFGNALLLNEDTHYSFRKNPFGYLFASTVCGWQNVSPMPYTDGGDDRRPIHDPLDEGRGLGELIHWRPVLVPAWYKPRYGNWDAPRDNRVNTKIANLSQWRPAVVLPVSVIYHQHQQRRQLRRQHPWMNAFRPLVSVEIREPMSLPDISQELDGLSSLAQEERLRKLQLQVVEAIEG